MSSLRHLMFAVLPLAIATPGSGHDHGHPTGPVDYVQNKGQWPQHVLYRTSVPGAVAFWNAMA